MAKCKQRQPNGSHSYLGEDQPILEEHTSAGLQHAVRRGNHHAWVHQGASTEVEMAHHLTGVAQTSNPWKPASLWDVWGGV